jgi:N-acetylglucosaminyldiphosphoundecaprenol N-acetyl-beta-D-mannosaminyltransferase
VPDAKIMNPNPTILTIPIFPTNYQETVEQIRQWSLAREHRSVYTANVHMLMEAHDHAPFFEVLQRADRIVPDGMPLVWMLRLKGYKDQSRVYGPSLMLKVLAMAEEAGIPVGFYGTDPSTLEQLFLRTQTRFPRLKIIYRHSPPFRKVTPEEDALIISEINSSGARILFVGLGCPRQEQWIFDHREQIPLVMIGAGAAFDFQAGTKKQAPGWIQKIGMEWFFRFVHEPRRLWKRYLIHNFRFVILAAGEMIHPGRHSC